MSEIQKIKHERDTYKNIIVQQKVRELLPEISKKGLDVVLGDVISMAMDAEVRAQAAEQELRKYQNNSIKIEVLRFGRR